MATIEKIRRKEYGNPWLQLTDQVGVRVIVYYAEDVDAVVSSLTEIFEIDSRRSADKRTQLQLRQFGYRSVHLIARVKHSQRLSPLLQRIWFEVQIRSILEHAWAEIEHEICYKSGIRYPEYLLRRFGALAGALEILDAEFASLRNQRDALIDELKGLFGTGDGLDDTLDASRLVAFLEVVRPDGLGWRSKDGGRPRFEPSTAAACVEALRASGIRTAKRLSAIMQLAGFRRLLGSFASDHGIGPDEVSHLAVAVLAATTADRETLRAFPDLLVDSALRIQVLGTAAF